MNTAVCKVTCTDSKLTEYLDLTQSLLITAVSRQGGLESYLHLISNEKYAYFRSSLGDNKGIWLIPAFPEPRPKALGSS